MSNLYEKDGQGKMEFTYENQGANTYLCCDLTDLEIDTMALGMITNNRIRGVAPSVFTQIDGRKYVRYNVSSKVSMKQFFSGAVSRKRLLGVFSQIADALVMSEEYMLDINSMVLDTNYIFVNTLDYSVEVVCVPVTAENGGNAEMAGFFKNLLCSVQSVSSENRDYVAELLNFLNQPGAFSVLHFKELLDRLKRQDPGGNQGSVKSGEAPPADRADEKAEEPVRPVQQLPPAEGTGGAAKQPEPWIGGQPAYNPDKSPASAQTPDKEISLFYLLQHYNEENARIYREQREAKKQKAGKSVSKESQKGKGKRKKPGEESAAGGSAPFAIPGQPQMPSAPVQPAPPVPPSAQQVIPCPADDSVAEQSLELADLLAEQLPYSPGDNFGETEYFDPDTEDAGTVWMEEVTDTQRMNPYLVRLKNKERIPLGKEVLRIGRDRGLADYAIPENKYVGHIHCHIFSRDEEFYIVDDNSINHTYVDGAAIQSNAEVKLSHGTLISVADEEFEVRLF